MKRSICKRPFFLAAFLCGLPFTLLFATPIVQEPSGFDRLLINLPFGLRFGMPQDSARSMLDTALGKGNRVEDILLPTGDGSMTYTDMPFLTFEAQDMALGFYGEKGLFSLRWQFAETDALATWEKLHAAVTEYLGPPQGGRSSLERLARLRETNADSTIRALVREGEVELFSMWEVKRGEDMVLIKALVTPLYTIDVHLYIIPIRHAE